MRSAPPCDRCGWKACCRCPCWPMAGHATEEGEEEEEEEKDDGAGSDTVRRCRIDARRICSRPIPEPVTLLLLLLLSVLLLLLNLPARGASAASSVEQALGRRNCSSASVSFEAEDGKESVPASAATMGGGGTKGDAGA